MNKKTLFLTVTLATQLQAAEWAKIMGLTTAVITGYSVALHTTLARISPEFYQNGWIKEDIESLKGTICDRFYQIIKNNEKSPTIVGGAWGLITGLQTSILPAIFFASIARVGSKPPLSWRDLVVPLGISAAVTTGWGFINGTTHKAFSYDTIDGTPWVPNGYEDACKNLNNDKRSSITGCTVALRETIYAAKVFTFGIAALIGFQRNI